ncbi:helix-turn-helix domain-containing protein [Vagococcus sp. BWB3-3]|uniref:Helix-turn-helix domain-containing protein n=1 Tax=Vagococcus allomyrinae TaxID=2794353 RepID=A0A940SRB2_9ENTE|nr:helix-turn-helix domain-containing protein [Vagococcus allomyrinae]MBP1040617.1 helix-turn-helix domain-containing protein [Vagococcus allomyrinae]
MKKYDSFILSLFQHGDKVRYSTLAHLLRGKRTTSILMYGFFYGVLPYFSLFPKMTEEQLNPIIQTLIGENLLVELAPGIVQISQKGKDYLKSNPVIEHVGLNSFYYGRVDKPYLELVLFATQVVSEYCHHNVQYQPIETNGYKQYVIRHWFQTLPKDRQLLGRLFYQEWQGLIASFPEMTRPFAVAFLTGHGQIGQTASQLAESSGLAPFEMTLIIKQLSHLGIHQILTFPERFSYLGELYQRLDKPVVNESAFKTYQLFQKGFSLAEICQERRLKESTVSDHLIEWAIIQEDFDFSRVLTTTEKAQLGQLLTSKGNVRDWRYADLGRETADISFFAFRCFQIHHLRGG